MHPGRGRVSRGPIHRRWPRAIGPSAVPFPLAIPSGCRACSSLGPRFSTPKRYVPLPPLVKKGTYPWPKNDVPLWKK